MHARPAYAIGALGRDAQPQRAEEGMLDGLHVAEEIAEVDDPRHVRFGELHPALNRETVRHRINGPFPAYRAFRCSGRKNRCRRRSTCSRPGRLSWTPSASKVRKSSSRNPASSAANSTFGSMPYFSTK